MRPTDLARLSLVLVLAGCGAAETPPSAAPTTGPAAKEADCGAFDLAQGETVPESAARCLIDAVQAQRAARLKVSEPTVEGDPIITSFTAYTGGGVEVVLDSRSDGFGPKAVTTRTCTGVSYAGERVEAVGCSEPKPVRS